MTYAFGLWKENFAHGLTWRVDRDDDISVNESQISRSSKIYQNYYAPTWSWASVTDQITYPKYPGEALVEILDIHCVPASRNKYGPALEGRIKLSGPVCEVRPRRLLEEREFSSPGCANSVHVVFEAVSVEDEHLSEYVLQISSAILSKCTLINYTYCYWCTNTQKDEAWDLMESCFKKHAKISLSMNELVRSSHRRKIR